MTYNNIRERSETIEKQTLCEYASLSSMTKGREKPEKKCEIRTEYQRDRDRIIHCKSFRRLKHKTQVFLSPEGDHYRTRLTHTLEVSQIARTIAKALLLNEDLAEAIALAHDLGHTPFGHSGESVLNQLSKHGFKHFEQSVRVVDKLEKEGKGLNLTYEVRDGILNHTRGKQPETLEGQIVRLADRIAYINHDIDDAMRAGVLQADDIPIEVREIVGNTTSSRINSFVASIIFNSENGVLKMSPAVQKVFDQLHTFMYENVYVSPYAKQEEKKIPDLIGRLFSYFINNPDKMPPEFLAIAHEEDIDRAVCDYIAGMTDPYAISIYEDIYIPRGWNIK